MLTITRHEGEEAYIIDTLTEPSESNIKYMKVIVSRIVGDRARIGFDGNPSYSILRAEVMKRNYPAIYRAITEGGKDPKEILQELSELQLRVSERTAK